MGRQHGPLCPTDYQVDKVVNVSGALFASFMDRPLDRYEFLEENTVKTHQYNGPGHCLLVLGEDRADGILIRKDGRAVYTAYVAGARDLVQAMGPTI